MITENEKNAKRVADLRSRRWNCEHNDVGPTQVATAQASEFGAHKLNPRLRVTCFWLIISMDEATPPRTVPAKKNANPSEQTI